MTYYSKLLISRTITSTLNILVRVYYHFSSPHLQVRWYQAAAWHPFFRGHAHEQTLRREPYLLPPDHRRLVRDALRRRQSFTPYLYTLFYENERLGLPVMRPLWAEFPTDAATFDMDDAFMLGIACSKFFVINSCTHNLLE